MKVKHEIEVSGGKVTLTEEARDAAVLMVAFSGERTAIHLTPAARAALKAVL